MTTLTKSREGGDFVIYRDSAQYCFLSAPVENANAAAVDLTQVAAMPVIIDDVTAPTKATLLEVGTVGRDEADVNGFLVEGPKQSQLAGAKVTADKYAVIWAGPNVLNETVIPALDAYGGSITLANIKSAILALNRDFKFAAEPVKQTVQTPDTGV